VQLARFIGARVIALTGEQWKQERLLALGADVVLSYRDPDWPQAVRAAAGARGVTVAFDNGGTSTLPKTLECLGRTGKLVCSGGTSGLEATINIRTLYRNHISLLFYVQGAKRDMERLVELVATGELTPVIDREYPLSEAAGADDHLDTGQHFGRIVLRVDPRPPQAGRGSPVAGAQLA
jgi:NADPH:quinone reductase-like Zn-dependent oxidoreductase